MEHFSEHSWADFARGFGASGEAQAIASHLAAGCLDCTTAHTFWGRLQSMAVAESAYTPPENLVHLVRVEFAAKHQRSSEKWTLANLLFDSCRQPLLAGVRSGTAQAWQLVYEAEGLTVDLRVDRAPQNRKVSVVGQVLDKRLPHAPMAGAPVVLWTEDGQLVATTEANTYGEFQLEFEPRDGLRLTTRVGNRKVKIPLANLK